MIANYHSHTIRCNHATGSEREYIERAIRRGLKILGFSDHAPQLFPGDYYSNFRMRPGELEDYVRTLTALREEYKKDIKILIGLETEYYPEIFTKLTDFLKSYPIDYMILGQHAIDNEYDTHRFSSGCRTPERLKQYVDQVLEGLSTGKFAYLAHPDLPNFDGSDKAYLDGMRPLIEGCRRMNIPLEINFLGIKEDRQYPDERFWALAGELGCTAIFGCDAHHTEDMVNPAVLAEAEALAARFGLNVIEALPSLS